MATKAEKSVKRAPRFTTAIATRHSKMKDRQMEIRIRQVTRDENLCRGAFPRIPEFDNELRFKRVEKR